MQVIEAVDNAMDSDAALGLGIKIGFATKDMVAVNQHFGSAESLAIYDITPDSYKFLEVFQFGQLAQDGNEGKLEEKIAALDGCAAVYCHAIGASAVRQLLAKSVQPVKITDNIAIKDLIELLQQEMRSGPSSWLAKAIDRQNGPDGSRFDLMEAEGWDE